MRTFFYVTLLFCSQPVLAADEITFTPKQIESLGIQTITLPDQHGGELSGMPAQVIIPGDQQFILSTPFPAMVEQMRAEIGENVRKGQVLARLQSPALAETQRGLIQAHSQQTLARQNLTRDEQLWKDGIISETRYRTTQSLSAEADAAYAERRQALRIAGMPDSAIRQLQEGKGLDSALEIRAPIDGVVLEKNASAGQRLDAATPLYKVARLKPLALEIQAPLAATRSLKLGAVVSVPAFQAKGKLTAIGRNFTGGNQAIPLRALLREGTENLRPGQFVEASIATQGAAPGNQWDIPNSAIIRLEGQARIFIATANGFRALNIDVVHEGAQHSLVSGELKGGEQIATRGVSSLKAKLMGLGGGE